MSPDRFTIDHIMLQSLGGSDELNNLAPACRRCNERHYNLILGVDPQTQEQAPLFNSRQQQWSDHFIWTKDGTKILSTTPIGRATYVRLDFNDERRDEPSIQTARRFWVVTSLLTKPQAVAEFDELLDKVGSKAESVLHNAFPH